jgi:hypothetical protein
MKSSVEYRQDNNYCITSFYEMPALQLRYIIIIIRPADLLAIVAILININSNK